jgi:hypothetical protein
MIHHTWLGPVGNLIELSNTDAGVWLTDGGVEGLGVAKTKAFVRQTPALAGQRFTGFSAEPRDVFWPIAIDSSVDGWKANQARLWGSLVPGEYGVWTVTLDGVSRTLECRFSGDGGVPYTGDPSVKGLESAGISLVADDPWWKGPQFLAQFQPVEDVRPFFAVTSDRVFNLMSSSTVASATVANSGDVEAWPKYTITGPVSEFSATISGGIVSSVTNVVDGAVLVIDTDPTVQRAVLTVAGVASTVTRDLVGVDWRPVPAGGEVSLDVTLQGTGSLVVSFLPRFYRAW